MQRSFVVATAVLTVTTGLAFAQEAGGPQGPTAEHKRLGYFVGTWSTTGEMKPNPFMPGGPTSSTDTCEWFAGGYTLVCRYDGKGPMGPMKGMGFMSWSPDAKAYTYYGVDNGPMVMLTVPKGKLQGDTWTYDDESPMGGKMVKSRYTIKELSPTSYTFTWSIQGEDGAWQPLMEGKAKKQ